MKNNGKMKAIHSHDIINIHEIAWLGDTNWLVELEPFLF